MACIVGNVTAVQRLIEGGVECNCVTIGGETPLMKAATSGKEQIAALLL